METGTEIDQLLAKAVARGEALKMPKPKLHWKQARKKQQERDRAFRASPYQVVYRKALTRSLRRKYNELKRVMLKRGQEFTLSFDDWCLAWICCPQVNGAPAWWLTGRGKGKVRAERIDWEKGWTKDNLQIVHGKKVLWRE